MVFANIKYDVLYAFCTGICLCSTLHGTAEPMYPVLSKDSVNKLLLILPKTKADTNRVNILLSLVDFYLPYPENDDSTKSYIGQALSLSELLHFRNGQARAHCMSGRLMAFNSDTSGSVKEIFRAISISRQERDLGLEAFAWFNLAESRTIISIDNSNETYYRKAIELYKLAGNRVNEAYALKTLADKHLNQGKKTQSLKELFEVLNLYRSAGYKKLHYTFDLIGAVYVSMSNYDEALKYSLAALNSAQQTKDTTDIAQFYARIGAIYYDLGQYVNAIEFDKHLLMYGQQTQKIIYIRNAAGEIASCLIKLKKPAQGLKFYLESIALYPAAKNQDWSYLDGCYLGDLYLSLKDYYSAEKYYRQMVNSNTTAYNSRFIKRDFLIKMGNLLVMNNEFFKAKKYLVKALNMGATNSILGVAQIHQLLFMVDSANGDYLSAIRNYQIYKSINDSTFNEKKSNQIASLEIQYETEKKDQDIVVLNAKNKEQQIVLKQQIFQRNAIIVGAFILLLFIWFIYNRYQLRNKTALQLEAQQKIINGKNNKLEELLMEKEELLVSKDELISEKEWLIKEVHHRVKNNLQIIISLLNTQSSYLENDAAVKAIRESQERMHAISLIHQKLYNTEDTAFINIREYVQELIDHIRDGFSSTTEILFDLHIIDTQMDVAQAVPLGLILNEAISNALKYAFNSNSSAPIMISISLTEKGDNYVLTCSDNGPGLPSNYSLTKKASFGMRLMDGLTKQLSGSFKLESINGVKIEVVFKDSKVINITRNKLIEIK